MNSVSPQLLQCGGPVGTRGPTAVSVLVATYSAGVEGPMPESTFPPDSEAWSTKTARIIALRKEKSRDAARNRRGKENYEYYELAKMLPLPSAITSQLDKASIIRLTISYLKIRDFAMQGDPPWHNYLEGHGGGVARGISSVLQGRFSQQHSGISAIAQEVYEHNLGGHILQAFDGFLFALSNDGRFLYISETVSIYLGLSQVELTGSSVFDYIHIGDQAELAEQLGMKLPTPRTLSQTSPGTGSSDGCQSSPMDSPTSPHSEPLGLNMTSPDNFFFRSFVIRMKSTLTKRGVHIKSSGYKVVHITGSMRPRMVLTQYSRHAPVIMGFTAVAQSLPPPTINEIHLEPTMFVCKLDLDLTIVFCEAKIQEFIDLSADDVTDKSLYSFLHAQDIKNMRCCHSDLLTKGQMITHYYRWMCKSGGYVWMQSTATLAYARTSNDRSFMFINQVITNPEALDTVMDISQMSSLPVDVVKGETSDGSGHNSDIGNTSTDEGKGKSPKTEKVTKPAKKTAQETAIGRGKASSRIKKRKTHVDHRDTKRHRQASPDNPDRAFVREDLAEPKTVIVDGSAEVKGQGTGALPAHGSARKPKKVMEDQHSRQLKEDRVAFSPAVRTGSDTSCHQCEAIEREASPGYVSPIEPSVNSNGRDSDSFSNGSHGAGARANEGWDNPPNREVLRDPEGSRSYREVGKSNRQVGTDDSIVIPKASHCKGNSGCSPKPPDSMLTPPLSDSCQSQFVLPPVSSLSETKTKHYSTDSIPSMLTSSNNNNNPTLSISKGFHHQPAVSPDVELISHQPAPGTQSKSHPTNPPADMDSPTSSNPKPEHLYNTHPRVITAVSSAYAAMPYASYGQYTNFQQYANPVNLAAHHGYQSSHYTDPYKNFRSAHHDMPMDLSYNNVGTYANMSILHSNVTGGGTTHPYYHASKMGYTTAPEPGLQIIPDRPCLDDPTKGTNTKV